MDEVWVALSADGLLRARVVRADTLCADAVARHGLMPLAAMALSRGLVCAALVPLSEKDDLKVSVQWAGAGPLRSVFCEARPASPPEAGVRVRGNVKEPKAELWAYQAGAGAIGRALMPGVVRIMRQAKNGSVSQGEVELVSGELDSDLEAVFASSEQVLTRARALVALDGSEGVAAARGVLVQAMPGCDPARVSRLTLDVGPGDGLEALVLAALGPDAQVLERQPLSFSCPCSRDRALSGIALLGHDDVIDMIVKDGGAEVKCEMCGAVYRFTQDELLPLVEVKPGQA